MREDLLKIARTTLGSKILSQHKEHFASLAVDAVLRLKSSGNLDAIQVIKKLGGSMNESYLDEGTRNFNDTVRARKFRQRC
jgi:T-complex protein 1 subunit beta